MSFHIAETGRANPAALLPSWGPELQAIAKLQTQMPQEWAGMGLSRGASCNRQEHIPWAFPGRISVKRENDRCLK